MIMINLYNNRLLIVMIACQSLLLTSIAWRTGPDWDEWGHFPSGLYTIEFGDQTPYCVNPPLTRIVTAVVARILGCRILEYPIPSGPGARPEFSLGLNFVHQFGEGAFFWVSVARIAAIPFAIFGTLLIWVIGRRLFTRTVAYYSAALWVFSPTVLTYGASITPDVTAAVFGLLASWRCYIWLRLGTRKNAVWVGFTLALAMLSKASWLIFPPIFLAISLIYAMRFQKRWHWLERLRQCGILVALCWLTIHAMYEFEGCLVPLGQFEFVSRSFGGVENDLPGVTPHFGNRFRNSWLGHVPAPLPAAYMRGIDIQKHDFEAKMASYFFGEWRDYGWWYYYIIGMWLKEPVALWLMAVGGLGIWGAKRFRLGSRTRMVSRLIVFGPGIALLVFVSSQTGFNHHLRYVLPFIPCFYLLVASGISGFKGWGRVLAVGLLAWYAISSLSIMPRSYAFFTEAVGGPSEGWKYLGDSNLDWGQDILTAKKWIEANPDKRPVYLVYSLPMIDFRKLGIDAEDGKPAVTLNGPTQPGWWVVFARPLLDPENRWFRENKPTNRLSVTTSVFEISGEDASNNKSANTAEATP